MILYLNYINIDIAKIMTNHKLTYMLSRRRLVTRGSSVNQALRLVAGLRTGTRASQGGGKGEKVGRTRLETHS